jgi:AbrB family looped-hinge helix DNA binding protein
VKNKISIDDKGRILVPIELRLLLELSPGDKLRVQVKEEEFKTVLKSNNISNHFVTSSSN